MIDLLNIIIAVIAFVIWFPAYYLLDRKEAVKTGEGFSSMCLIWVSGLLFGFVAMYYIYPTLM